MENLNTALLLMVVGMATVFAILLIKPKRLRILYFMPAKMEARNYLAKYGKKNILSN